MLATAPEALEWRNDKDATKLSMMVNPTVEQITRAIEEKRAEFAEFLDMLHAQGQTVSITINSNLGTWTCSFRAHPKAAKEN